MVGGWPAALEQRFTCSKELAVLESALAKVTLD